MREQALADQHFIGALPKAYRHAFGRVISLQGLLQAAGGIVQALIIAGQGDVGLGIKRVASIHQALQHLGRVGVQEHGAMFPPSDTADQHRKRAFQPDGNGTTPANRSPRGGIGKGTAAGCQHQGRAGQQAGNHAPLTIAEMRLAIAGKDFRDWHASGVFNFRVGVSKR